MINIIKKYSFLTNFHYKFLTLSIASIVRSNLRLSVATSFVCLPRRISTNAPWCPIFSLLVDNAKYRFLQCLNCLKNARNLVSELWATFDHFNYTHITFSISFLYFKYHLYNCISLFHFFIIYLLLLFFMFIMKI